MLRCAGERQQGRPTRHRGPTVSGRSALPASLRHRSGNFMQACRKDTLDRLIAQATILTIPKAKSYRAAQVKQGRQTGASSSAVTQAAPDPSDLLRRRSDLAPIRTSGCNFTPESAKTRLENDCESGSVLGCDRHNSPANARNAATMKAAASRNARA